jgi:hypothetical protein
MSSKFHPNFSGLNVRNDGPQPCIFVRTLSPITSYHFPQECVLLSQKVKEYRRQQSEQRYEAMREEIRQTVLAFHAQGIYPSHRKVGERIAHPTLMRHPEARAFRLALCRDLGWI